jgi:hypothetical protein
MELLYFHLLRLYLPYSLFPFTQRHGLIVISTTPYFEVFIFKFGQKLTLLEILCSFPYSFRLIQGNEEKHEALTL